MDTVYELEGQLTVWFNSSFACSIHVSARGCKSALPLSGPSYSMRTMLGHGRHDAETPQTDAILLLRRVRQEEAKVAVAIQINLQLTAAVRVE